MLQAIICDFDGVLADTETLHLRAFQEVLGEHGIDLADGDYFDRYLGLDDAAVVRAVLRDRGLVPSEEDAGRIVQAKTARYGRLVSASDVLFAGAEARVREWSRELPLAIASGALAEEIEAILGRRGLLACFRAIVSARDVSQGKPAPDPYLVALERLREVTGFAGAEPGAIVAIEDAPAGIQSAGAAGLRVVAVTTNCPANRLAQAQLVVPSIAALDLAILRKVAMAIH